MHTNRPGNTSSEPNGGQWTVTLTKKICRVGFSAWMHVRLGTIKGRGQYVHDMLLRVQKMSAKVYRA